MHIHKPNAFFVLVIVLLVTIPILTAIIVKVVFNPLEPKEEIVIDTSSPNVLSVSKIDDKGQVVIAKKIRFLNLATYNDVPPQYWAAKQIGLISAIGLLQGYPDHTFKPTHSITRAEMATILIKARGLALAETSTVLFKDVPAKSWSAKYINLAEKLGIITGYPDGYFYPQKPVTRAEGVAMVTRFAFIPSEPYENYFTDVKVSDWVAGSLAGAVKAGIVRYANKVPFRPKQNLTRAEAAEMLLRTEIVKQKVATFLNLEDSGRPSFLSKEKVKALLKKSPALKTTPK